MPAWTRVRDKSTGHEFSVVNVNTKAHEVLDKPAVDRNGSPLPAKPRVATGAAKSAPADESSEPSEPYGSQTEVDHGNGLTSRYAHKATTKKE